MFAMNSTFYCSLYAGTNIVCFLSPVNLLLFPPPAPPQISAHKLILSACSDFFRHLLRRNPAPNPIIVLWDMGAEDIRKILRFMYNGEVEVRQAHLNNFLAVAERLRVRGLCQSGGKSSPNPSSSGNNNSGGGGGGGNSSSSSSNRRAAGTAATGGAQSPRSPGPASGSSRPDSPSSSSRQRRPHSPDDPGDTGGGRGKKPRVGDGGGGSEDDIITVKEESHPPPTSQRQQQQQQQQQHQDESRSEGDYGDFPGGSAFDDHGGGGLPALMSEWLMPSTGFFFAGDSCLFYIRRHGDAFCGRDAGSNGCER